MKMYGTGEAELHSFLLSALDDVVNLYHRGKCPYYIQPHVKDEFIFKGDRLCGLVIRAPGYRSRGPGFDSRCYQIF
jgi:hypothetical protein